MGRQLPIIVLVGTALHLIWAIGLIIDPAAHSATAIHALFLLTNDDAQQAIGILLLAAASGLIAITLGWRHHVWRILLMLPQQSILIMSSVSAGSAMAASSFADGVIRPQWFIIVDQVPVVLIAIGYLVSIARIARENGGHQ